MTQTEDSKEIIEEQDIVEEMEKEIEEIEAEDGSIDEEKLEEALHPKREVSAEEENTRDVLARTLADFDNFKKRTERDKADMIFFLKSDIFKKVLPRFDDLERMLKNTPEDQRNGALYEGLVSLQSTFEKDLASFGLESFSSIWEVSHPDKHDVMTTVPGQPEGIICDEFEKGYTLWGRILRHAKVVVGAG